MRLSTATDEFAAAHMQAIRKTRAAALDCLIALLIATALFSLSVRLSHEVSRELTSWEALDAWFGADIPRVDMNMRIRTSDQFRASVHPLFPAVGFGLTDLFRVFGAEGHDAVRFASATVAAAWGLVFYLLARLVLVGRVAAVALCLLAGVSASSLFFFSVPETYAWGSLTLLVPLLLLAVAEHRSVRDGWLVAASTASLGMTITNGMAGAAAIVTLRPWKRAVALLLASGLLLAALWWLQLQLFPSAGFFGDIGDERRFMRYLGPGSLLHALAGVFSHPVVMPEISVRELRPNWTAMSVARSWPGMAGATNTIATCGWIALLVVGAIQAGRLRHLRKFRVGLGLVILGQVALHMLYGRETFLYSLHFLPLVLLVASFALLPPLGRVTVPLTLVLIATVGVNNFGRFAEAVEIVETSGTQREQLRMQMRKRPTDPWPRGDGHIFLSEPGSSLESKSVYEPCGAFSPAPRSFGISVWLQREGKRLEAGGSIPEGSFTSRLEWRGELPSVHCAASDFSSEWSAGGKGTWIGEISRTSSRGDALAIAISSAGPAGGPVETLEWDGLNIIVNSRWRVEFAPAPDQVLMGDERRSRDTPVGSAPWVWRHSAGWGRAVARFTTSDQVTISIRDIANPTTTSAWPFENRPRVQVPDQRFSESIDAQIAHLMMSLVGDEDRGADPIHLPIPITRDGAYVVVALARAGQAEAAIAVASRMAGVDFAGPFGAEADAPGYALWAIGEVDRIVDGEDFAEKVWPHVKRKAELILEMMALKAPMRATSSTPVVRKDFEWDVGLVAEPPVDGLINGQMDHHRPLLFINAVSRAGLLASAAMARRLGHEPEDVRWQEAAAKLQAAWLAAFHRPELENDRTYAVGLWPTCAAAPIQDDFSDDLEARWQERRNEAGGFRSFPRWTYFELAEAHQWLWAGERDRAMDTVRWFFDNQVYEGLYTWWEGRSESHGFGGWDGIRGWARPAGSTPHYWTAAEMLLLQLDMLAYVNPCGDQEQLVIGAGVPTPWLSEPLRVAGLPTVAGEVSWSWNEGRLTVTINSGGPRIPVVAGAAFGPDVDLEVKWLP